MMMRWSFRLGFSMIFGKTDEDVSGFLSGLRMAVLVVRGFPSRRGCPAR